MSEATVIYFLVRMQRKVIQGIPVWLDTQNRVYAYDPVDTTNPLWLGTYSPQTETMTLRDDWKLVYQEKLEAYRKKSAPRNRLPAAAPPS